MSKVMEQYEKDAKEHELMIRNDPYYAFSCGGGRVPEPRCEYCEEFDPSRDVCTKNWNNLDPCYYNPDTDDQDPDNCCDDYVWNGDLEER